MAFIEPLDLRTLFDNTLAGGTEVFLILAFFAITAICAFFRMSNTVALIMLGLFGIFMASISQAYYFLVIVIAGFVIFVGIKRIFER